jgi:hypothetical protein
VRTLKRQGGAVLILLFVGLIMGAATIILAALNNGSPQLRDRLNKQSEMQVIKEALLAYAMANPEYNNAPNGPGRLPCSDTNNNGTMDCNNNAVGLGRLPEKIDPPVGGPVFLSDRYADMGQQFWYAVAPAFRQNSSSLNSNSTTTFSLDGVGGIAAVIIAPGPSIDGQVRNNSSQANRYLESNNVTGPDFLTNHPTDPRMLNDMIVSITVAEVMTFATLRVAQEVKRVLDIYYAANGNTYPALQADFSVAMTASGAAWVAANAWISSSLLSYTQLSPSVATVQFTNCAIVYTFEQAQSGFTRSQRSC